MKIESRDTVEKLRVYPKKVGVCIGGGGFYGAFEVGALWVLEKYGIPIDEIVGVSVGAINGAAFLAEGCSTRRLAPIWFSLKDPSIIFEREHAYRFLAKFGKVESIYRMEPLIKLIGNNLNAQRLIAQEKEFIAVTRHVPSKKEKFMDIAGRRPQHMKKTVFFSNKDPEMVNEPIKMLLAILASCAIPGMFPPVPIKYRGSHQYYIDGAFRRPLPIKKCIDDGCDTVIAIRCHSDKILGPFPEWWGERLSYGLGLLHDGMEHDEIKLFKGREDINLLVIEPELLPPTLNTVSFGKDDILGAMKEGRRIALTELAPLIEYFQK